MSGRPQGVGGHGVELAPGRRRRPDRAPLGQDLAQPVLEAVADRGAQAAGERAVRFGGVGQRALVAEQLWMSL